MPESNVRRLHNTFTTAVEVHTKAVPFDLASDDQNVLGGQETVMQLPYFLMCGQTNGSTVVPIIPSPHIDFIVVNGDDRYMIRCERKAVLENSVELAKLIHAGPNRGRRGDNRFQVSNVDKYDFELVIRYLETKVVRYRDHLHMLKILELANRFNCPDLIIYCIRNLDLQLTSATVLDICRSLSFYQNITPPIQHGKIAVITTQETSASKKAKRKSQSSSSIFSGGGSNLFTTDEYLAALLYNALQLIDMHAELVLTKQQITELRFEELQLIVKRESLQLSAETVLFHCIADWSTAECNRKKIAPNAENRRRVLGPLCYAPRYLLMKKSEFLRTCERVELLDTAEIAIVLDAFEGKKFKNISNEQAQMLKKFRTPRPEFAKMPIYLSDRSNPKSYPKKMHRAEKESSKSCCRNFGLNCFSVFSCTSD